MTENNVLYERDLLFSTDGELKVGAAHVKLCLGKTNNRLIVVVEPRSEHNLTHYVESLLKSLDTEIFGRINVSMTENMDIILISEGTRNKIVFHEPNSLASFHLEKLEN